MPKTKVKERKMKIYYNPEIPDQPFPELMSYKLLVETPEELKDISEAEATKLAGIESGADVTADHDCQHPLVDLSVTTQKLAEAAVEWEKIADEAVKANNIWTGGNVITLSAQIKDAVILNAHIGDAEIQSAKIGSLDANVINAGTLTGRLVRTSAGNERLEIRTEGEYANLIVCYYGGNMMGYFGSIGADGLIIRSASGKKIILGEAIAGGNALEITGNQVLADNLEPLSSDKNIGASGNKWQHLHLSGNIYVAGTVDGVDISAFKSSYDSHIGNVSAHHNKYSSGIAITPSSVNTGAGTIVTSGWIQGGYLYGNTGAASYKIADMNVDGKFDMYVPIIFYRKAYPDPSAATGKFYFNTSEDRFRGYDGSNFRDICFYDERNDASPIPTFASGLEQLKKIKEPTILAKEGLCFNTPAFPKEFKVKRGLKQKEHIDLKPVIGMLIKGQKEILERVENLEQK